MRTTVVVLVIAIVVMATWVRSLSQDVRALNRSLQEVQAKASDKVTNASLELQAKCFEQARKVFTDLGYAKSQMAGYENHYNSELNKCFVQIQNTDTKVPGTIWTFKNVIDAFEGKEYGTYSWHTEKDKKYWEVPPFQCEVTLSSGEKKSCRSDAEFTDLVKAYMQGGR